MNFILNSTTGVVRFSPCSQKIYELTLRAENKWYCRPLIALNLVTRPLDAAIQLVASPFFLARSLIDNLIIIHKERVCRGLGIGLGILLGSGIFFSTLIVIPIITFIGIVLRAVFNLIIEFVVGSLMGSEILCDFYIQMGISKGFFTNGLFGNRPVDVRRAMDWSLDREEYDYSLPSKKVVINNDELNSLKKLNRANLSGLSIEECKSYLMKIWLLKQLDDGSFASDIEFSDNLKMYNRLVRTLHLLSAQEQANWKRWILSDEVLDGTTSPVFQLCKKCFDQVLGELSSNFNSAVFCLNANDLRVKDNEIDFLELVEKHPILKKEIEESAYGAAIYYQFPLLITLEAIFEKKELPMNLSDLQIKYENLTGIKKENIIDQINLTFLSDKERKNKSSNYCLENEQERNLFNILDKAMRRAVKNSKSLCQRLSEIADSVAQQLEAKNSSIIS